MDIAPPQHSPSPRIPEALQAVWLNSNGSGGGDDGGGVGGNVGNGGGGGGPQKEVSNVDATEQEKGKKMFVFPKKRLFKNSRLKKLARITVFMEDRKLLKRRRGKRMDETSESTCMTSDSEEIRKNTRPSSCKDSSQQIPSPAPKLERSPQRYLDDMLYSRGYPSEVRKSMLTGYFNKPTALQKASYNPYLISLAYEGKVKKLRGIVMSGISPNPCNVHGESLLHAICRRCKPEVLELFLDAGASVQVTDDYGRTLLHDACWRTEPSFEMIEMIARKDMKLFYLSDIRGATPLSYVQKQDWGRWIQFFEAKKDILWPETDPCQPEIGLGQLELLNEAPLTCPLPNPPNALPVELAALVTAGRLSPEEALVLCRDENGSKRRLSTTFSREERFNKSFTIEEQDETIRQISRQITECSQEDGMFSIEDEDSVDSDYDDDSNFNGDDDDDDDDDDDNDDYIDDCYSESSDDYSVLEHDIEEIMGRLQFRPTAVEEPPVAEF